MYEENGVTVMASDKDLKRFKLCFSLYNPQKTLMKVLVSQLYPALCEPHELQLNRFLCPWNFPGKNTGVEFSSVIYWCPTLCNPMNCSMPGLPVHHQLLETTQTHVHWVGDAIQTSHPLLSPSPALNLSQHQGLFQCVSSPHQGPEYWSFSFNISPSNEYPGLISFRMDWLDILAVQETLKSLLQNHSSKALILLHSAFFIVQLSHPYTTTGKTIALTRRIFVGKVMSLFFNMLFRLIITFLPRSKRLLI